MSFDANEHGVISCRSLAYYAKAIGVSRQRGWVLFQILVAAGLAYRVGRVFYLRVQDFAEHSREKANALLRAFDGKCRARDGSRTSRSEAGRHDHRLCDARRPG